MARARVNPEIRAAAIADLLTGDQPAVVAERYGLDPAKVRVWKQRHVTPLVTPDVTPHEVPVVTPPSAPLKRPAEDLRHLTLSELVEANLRAKLIATQRIVEHASRDEWLAQQNATALAELFEALDRSAIGILDRLAGGAAQRALPAPGAEDDGGAAA